MNFMEKKVFLMIILLFSLSFPFVSADSGVIYSLNFYIAIGLAILGILIILLFMYLFHREPKDKWDKKSNNHAVSINNQNSKVVKS